MFGKPAEMTKCTKPQAIATANVVDANSKLVDSLKKFVDSVRKLMESDPTLFVNSIIKLGVCGVLLVVSYRIANIMLDLLENKLKFNKPVVVIKDVELIEEKED